MFERLFGEKFSRFRLGQIIFATAVSFGLFAGDIIRIVLGVLALFFLTKENFKFNWTRGQKITGCILALFCAWMIVIPVIFGENPLPVRLRDAVRPVELTLWICATLLFAKDDFFVRNLKNFSITACFLYSLIALHWCFETHFALEYKNWPVLDDSHCAGALMSGIAVWIMCEFVTAKNPFKVVFCFVTLGLGALLTIFARFSTFWVALAAEFLAALTVLLFTDRKKFLKLLLCLVLLLSLAIGGINTVMKNNAGIRAKIDQELNQLTSLRNKNLECFTSHRAQIWEDTAKAVAQKPFFGYGKDVLKQHIRPLPGGTIQWHAHNNLLEAAFEAGIPCALLLTVFCLSLFLLAAFALRNSHSFNSEAFVCVVLLAGYFTAGLAENLYMTDRCKLVFYWSVFAACLALCNNKCTNR